MNPKPFWRWWLFCASLDVFFCTGWLWAGDLMNWCVLPEWVGDDGVACDRLDRAANE